MRSGIFNIWKYARVLWMALTIIICTSAIFARPISVHHFFKKDGLPSTGILTGYLEKEQENILEETCFGINRTKLRRILCFDFLNYHNPSNDCFHCRLEGYTKYRTYCGRILRLVYNNLPSQNYTLIAESLNLNYGNNAATPAIGFSIRDPWWRLWYVQAAVILLLLAFITLIMRKTISRVKRKEREKAETARKIAELEIIALQAQMNPHFIFNSINSIQYFVLSNKTDDVLSYLSDFSKVVRASLANLTKKSVPLNEEIDFLKSYLRIENMRFPDKFEFSVEVKGALNLLGIMIPPYLIQPFTENTVKHGFIHKYGTGHLSVVFQEYDSETLKCTITDDGIGRAKAHEIGDSRTEPARPHSSVITETRIRLLNTPAKPDRYKVIYTDLTDCEGKSAGLKVEVYLPIEKV